MQLPDLTHDQIQSRCTEQSFERGFEYFHGGAIGNPVLQDWTLSSTCQGSSPKPYRTTVELMPTGIVSTHCSCLYEGDGDCKHIAALLLTYVESPETLYSVEDLLATLAGKPKSSLLQIISELLKRSPELARIAQVYADIPVASPDPEKLPLVSVYTERIEHIFGHGFLEEHQLRDVITHLEGLLKHAEFFAQLGETEFALSILHALIHQSILHYSDTLQSSELPRFISKCTKAFAQIATDARHLSSISEHCQLLLHLSFDAEPLFTRPLTRLIEQLCLTQDTADLQLMIERHLETCLDRRAYVRLLLALYLRAGKTEAYFHLARSEGESYRLIYALFTCEKDDVAWKTLRECSLSLDEHWALLISPIAKRIPNFTDKLLTLLRHYDPNIAVPLYHKLIEQTVRSRKRESYEKVRRSLDELRTLYQRCHQENQWTVYLANFRKRHARKRLLLQIIDGETSSCVKFE